MYGGGPGSNLGDASMTRYARTDEMDGIGSAAGTTAMFDGWMPALATAAVAAGAPSVLQQSVELPSVAHVSSPSLQHAIWAFVMDVAPSTHAVQTDQPKVAASTKAVTRATRETIEFIVARR